MASIGHVALAYFMSLGLNLNLRETLWLMLFSVVSDVSFIPLLVGIDVHRGFTHSLIFLLIPLAIYFLLSSRLALLASIGIGSHILIDLLDTRGVQLFFPLQNWVAVGVWPADPVSLTDFSIYFSTNYYVFDKALLVTAVIVVICEMARARGKKHDYG
ncbi:MAG: metal-dependent hydrolase [Candidatus Micrarchaeota archaeon]|nr:metal-dependent hydrolase [Candidatus Micrarchaeota archaeon]